MTIGPEGKNVRVSLEKPEAVGAALLGAQRHIESRFAGMRHKGPPKDIGWEGEIEGALAEVAAAKALGVYFTPGVNTLKGADLDGLRVPVQVRSTTNGTGSLIVRPGDPEDHVYVLVVGRAPNYRVVGWCWGRQAMQERFLTRKGRSDRGAAYFVPQKSLLPFPIRPPS